MFLAYNGIIPQKSSDRGRQIWLRYQHCQADLLFQFTLRLPTKPPSLIQERLAATRLVLAHS